MSCLVPSSLSPGSLVDGVSHRVQGWSDGQWLAGIYCEDDYIGTISRFYFREKIWTSNQTNTRQSIPNYALHDLVSGCVR